MFRKSRRATHNFRRAARLYIRNATPSSTASQRFEEQQLFATPEVRNHDLAVSDSVDTYPVAPASCTDGVLDNQNTHQAPVDTLLATEKFHTRRLNARKNTPIIGFRASPPLSLHDSIPHAANTWMQRKTAPYHSLTLSHKISQTRIGPRRPTYVRRKTKSYVLRHTRASVTTSARQTPTTNQVCTLQSECTPRLAAKGLSNPKERRRHHAEFFNTEKHAR